MSKSAFQRIRGCQEFGNVHQSRASEGEMERRYRLKAGGYDLDKLAEKAAHLFGLKGDDLLRPGKYGKVVEGRDLLCYWAVRELGWSVTNLAKRIGISQPAVGYAILRGEMVVREKGLQIVPK